MIKKIFRHRFVSATIWMTMGTGFLSFGNFLYHFIMVRLLDVVQYGLLESVIALLYILSIPLATLSLVIVKFISSYKGANDFVSLYGFYGYMRSKLFTFGVLFSLVLFALSPLITSFLHLPGWEIPLMLAVASIVWGFNVLEKGTLQGLSHFLRLSVANIIETVAKILLSTLLVIVGFAVGGAFFGIVFSAFVGYAVAHLLLKKFIVRSDPLASRKKLLHFAIPVFIITGAFASLYTTDILLVRHFFPGVESGYYAALSVLGKIIFFAASPLMQVMFPLVSEYHASKKKYTHFLFLSLALTLLIVSFGTLIFFLFPTFIVTFLLAGKDYLAITPYLGYFAIFMSLYALCFLLANFYLSIRKTKTMFFVVIGSLLQIVLIWVFHASLTEIINASIAATFLLLISLLVYYPYAKTKS